MPMTRATKSTKTIVIVTGTAVLLERPVDLSAVASEKSAKKCIQSRLEHDKECN